MTLTEEGYLLRVFIGESDKKDGIPLYEWIVRRAKKEGIAGATVLRGIEGYGGHSHIHTARILQLSTDLPVIVELIDTLDKIDAFMPILEETLDGGLVTQEKARIRLFRSKGEK
jgi:PII-like signaling protein